MAKELTTLELLRTLREASDTGFLPADFPYSPQQVKEILRTIRSKMIKLQEAEERMSENPKELIERVNASLTTIEQDFPQESKFLNIIVTQKLAPEEFYTKVMEVMCDLSNAQMGLVDPAKSMIILSNYVEILKLIRSDPTLKAEADKFASQPAPTGSK